MNETTTTKKSEFVFRRLGESFDQFVADVWAAVPLWLLAVVVALVVARVVYRYANPAARAGAKDPAATGLKVGMWLSVAAFVLWTLVAFYVRDTEQAKATPDSLSSIGSGNAVKWYSFVIGLFLVGSAFVVAMYVKDSRSVRWYWATALAALRMTVYAILCLVFLLPATQTWEDTNKQSRVVVLLDISGSTTSDKVTDDVVSRPGQSARTRMDVIIEFLTDERIAFLKNLLDRNPVAVYAFGNRLDEAPHLIGQGEPAWSKKEWEAFARYDFKPFLLRGLSDEGKEGIQKAAEWGDRPGTADWAATWFARRQDATEDLKKFANLPSDEETEKLRKNLEKLDKRIDVARTIAQATNVPDSVTAAVNREAANMAQGIIVISDGRSNLGSDSSYVELRERAAREKIPVFTIGVGEDRQTVAISISGVQAPDSAPIDEAWEVIVEADGTNMANKEVEVELHLYKPGTDMTQKDSDALPRADFVMPAQKLVFAPGDPPSGQAKFVIDPAKLPEHLTEESKDAAIKKRVLPEGKWGVIASIAKDPQEAYKYKYHTRARPDINVVQQKLRVLLVTGAPSREFIFLRTLLVREVQDKRATLATLVQNEAGTTGKLTPEAGETILGRFPTKFTVKRAKDDPDAAYNLDEYDLIVAFDPDWTELSQGQAEDLSRWVREVGGGLIYVAGPINTFQLARVEDGSRLSKLVDLLPVAPADIIAQRIKPIPKTPRRLYLNPKAVIGSDLLKLDDKVPDDPVAGWERFFTDRDKYAPDPDLKVELFPRRGFFSAYPLLQGREAEAKQLNPDGTKPGSAVLAELADVGETGDVVRVPWIVTNNPSSSYRTAFLASGELYKMRVFEPGQGTGREYFERFWFKMMKYMASKRNVKAPRGRVLVSKEAVAGAPLRVQARILNEGARPYEIGRIDAKFKIEREAPGGQKREVGPFDLAAKPPPSGPFDGYYAGQVLLADPPGEKDPFFQAGEFVYRVVVPVPDGGGELTGEFRIRKADPEMDNTKPDYPALLRMASEFDALQGRLDDKVRAEMAAKLPREGGVQRLAFKVTDAEALKLIPECMKTIRTNNQNRGPVNDLWDRGVALPASGSDPPAWWSGKTIPVSWVMLAVVSLLSLEWLTRKLLRLA